MLLYSLAAETFEEILGWLPTQHARQQATLQLTRAIPQAPIPLRHLFEVVRLHDASQVEGFHQRIQPARSRKEDSGGKRKDDEGGVARYGKDEGHSGMIQSLHIDAFDTNPEIVINVLALAQEIEHLSLCVGPLFLPAHLQAALAKPRTKLKTLDIRFRPCPAGQHKTPLDESYYDAALLDLARWPTPSSSAITITGHSGLRSLSLIQEPVISAINGLGVDSNSSEDVDGPATTSENTVKPAFSSFGPLTALLESPAMSRLRSLTISIPGKDVTLFTPRAALPSILNTSWSSALRSIEYLDLSTTDARSNHLHVLLSQLSRLRHITLNDTNFIPIGSSQNVQEGSWKALGKACALIGPWPARLMAMNAQSEVINVKLNEKLDVIKANVVDIKGMYELQEMANESVHSLQECVEALGLRSDMNVNNMMEKLRVFSKSIKEFSDIAIQRMESINGAGQVVGSQCEEERETQEEESDVEITSTLSQSSSTSEKTQPPRNITPRSIVSNLGLTHKTQIRIVPYPPSLQSLHVSLKRNNPNADVDGGEVLGNRQQEEETAGRLFKEGWESGLEDLRAVWGSLKTNIISKLSTSSDSSEVVLMFRESEPEEEGEEAHKESIFVRATTEALESLLAREFACPDLSFAGEGRDGKC